MTIAQLMDRVNTLASKGTLFALTTEELEAFNRLLSKGDVELTLMGQFAAIDEELNWVS